MDFTLLEKGAEQAQLDVSVQEEKEARAAGRKKSRKPIIGHERDDQMQIYLQEIRYKQGEMEKQANERKAQEE